MKEIKIGLIGFGTVGSGFVHWINHNAALISKRCGLKFLIEKIVVRDAYKQRDSKFGERIFTTDIESVVNNDGIDVIVELMGGTDLANDYVLKALNAGKPVITANKALLAHKGKELFEKAEERNTDIYYEASVGGGIPVIKALREGLAANHIIRIYGILNGTCNYILSRMENEGLNFKDALKEAKNRGYAEADPTLDINGMDTAHKTCILASLAYGEWYDLSSIHVEGIENIELCDIKNAKEAGYRIKLLGIVIFEKGTLQLRVHPTLIPRKSMLSHVNGVNNAAWISGDIVGETMFYGQGAGADATASSVVADLIDVGLNLKFNSSNRIASFRQYNSNHQVLSIDEITCRYYVRLLVDDRPDVLASITHIFGEGSISIASVSQKESTSNKLPIVLITHLAKEASIYKAVEKISSLNTVHEDPVLVRIQDL